MAASATPQLPKPPLHRPRLHPSVRSSATSSCRWAVGSTSSSPSSSRTLPTSALLTPQLATPCSLWEQTPFPTNDTFDPAVSDFISRQCIRCLVDNIHWESQTLDGVQSTCLLADQDELNHRVADFLRNLEAAPCNTSQTELSVRLTILQEITLPVEKFVEWTSWYYDQAAGGRI
ncbi:hypothetical protein RHMOL_Rhmol01G0274600 [Rhododendron molle]|uniref:Uncharacterized protein n=1 Tax=Rhododendron molle TaxID=49168 RepID=A0ACC0Q9A1_RHOML|nr:hypothetical protein RHMOL_Rhmol01G0274600 [Rhododendron molle]